MVAAVTPVAAIDPAGGTETPGGCPGSLCPSLAYRLPTTRVRLTQAAYTAFGKEMTTWSADLFVSSAVWL
jgi:hypothetical protein